jgi:hypothetical protein
MNMGQTLRGSLDLSSTNGFTQGVPQATGSPAWLNAVQQAEWAALVRSRGFDPNNYSSMMGAPERNIPTNVISNPGKAVEAPNAETSLVKNADGSVVGRMAGSSVVFNLPSPKTS